MTGKLKIEGVDKSTIVNFGSVRLRDNLNQRLDTLSFSISKYGTQTFVPEVGQEVEYFLNDGSDHQVFGGIIVNVNEVYAASGMLTYQCECSDYAYELDRFLVQERYEGQTVEDIIADLLATYATDFTGVNVSGTTTVETIAFNRIPLSRALERLAKLTGYSWYVDFDKDLHFFPNNSESAPFGLTDDSANYVPDSLELSTSLDQIRNRVLIRGGDTEGAPRTEYLSGDGTRKEWSLVYKYAEAPSITVGGVAKTVLPDNLFGLTDADFLWSYQQKTLRSNTAWVAGTNNIEVTGIPLVPVVVQVTDPVSYATHGPWEYFEKDDRIQSREEALQYAQTQLRAYKDGIREGSFTTETYGLRSGQAISISSALRGIAETYVIQSVSMKAIAIDKHEWRVELATARTLGVIDALQKLLLSEDISEDEEETLLGFLQFSDACGVTDEVTITGQATPYLWDDPGTKWNLFTWA